MDLDQKIGYLFVVPVCPKEGVSHLEKVSKLLKKNKIRNILLLDGDSESQIKAIQYINNQLDTPVIAFQDAEWGVGMRLEDVSPLPRNLTLGAIEDLSLLKEFGREIACQCHKVGIQGVFAPVVDVNSNPKNPVIHLRSFGDHPSKVAKRGLAVMRGIQEGGILTCAKHFPGHGDTMIDSHKGLPKIEKSIKKIHEIELAPFKALIRGGVEMVMVGHLHFPALSSLPSSLSKEIMGDLLRNELRFKGIVVTDALNMQALATSCSLEEVYKRSLLAGADLLVSASKESEELDMLITKTIPKACALIKNEVPEEIIDEKVKRILKCTQKVSISPLKENVHLRRDLYRKAVTFIGKRVPIEEKIALVQSHPDPEFEKFLKEKKKVEIFSFEEMDKAASFSSVILNIRKGDLPKTIPKQAIIALFDSPYTLMHFPNHPAIIGYEDVLEAKEAVADVICEKLTPLGKLPIQLFTE